MKYSIIIPTYNHWKDAMKPCLDSIYKSTDFRGVAEMIFVANGCTDETLAHLPTKLFDAIITEEPLGYTKAINRGIERAKGEFLILLNNDCVLLPQRTNRWIDMLLEPFLDSSVGITGPAMGQSRLGEFIVFFCAAIRRSVVEKIGLLDEQFSPGGYDDVDYCVRARNAGFVIQRAGRDIGFDEKQGVGITDFPIYHKGEKTMNDNPRWKEIFAENERKLLKKHDPKKYLQMDFERAAFSKNERLGDREFARYAWAAKNTTGNVFEYGCSAGYGSRFAPLGYHGVDKDSDAITFAQKEYGDRGVFSVGGFEEPRMRPETIWAMEVIEHLEDGLAVAQTLKGYADTVLLTVPYFESPGFWGPHHKLHRLTAEDFPGYSAEYMWSDCTIHKEPPLSEGGLLLLKYTEQCTS